MKRMLITCDKCGKEIEGKPARVSFFDTARDTEDADQALYEPDQDFCDDCVAELIALVDNFDPKQKKVEKKVERKKPKKTIDRGRVWALYDAGWKTKDIAVDACCSAQTVRNILNEERPIPEYVREDMQA